jgi:hypothetical protein
MPNSESPVVVSLELSPGSDSPVGETDQLTRQLLREIREADIDAELVRTAEAARGSKSIEGVATGQLLLTMLPVVLPKLVEILGGWLGRGSQRQVKLKLPNGVDFELTGSMSVDDIKKLVGTLGSAGAIGPSRISQN